MKTNDIKKGTRIRLNNGWFGTMMDNRKGNTRVAKVEGYVTEMGSVYAHDIVAYQDAEGNWQSDIEYTKSQLKTRKMVDSFF
jgi:hypothetical protein